MAAAQEATQASLTAGAAKNGSEDDANDDYEHRALLGTAHDPEPPKGRALTLLLCGIAAGIYEADALLIASVARHLTEEFGLSLSGLGSLMMVRAFIQACLMPLWGYTADRRSRTTLLAFGIFLWSLDAILLSQCRTIWQLLIVRGLAGVGLSAVPPVAHSIVSDLYAPEDRGNAFGWVGFGTIMGGSFGTLYGTNVGSVENVFGLHGWRFMFLTMGVIAMGLAVLIKTIGIDPPRGTMEPGFDPKAPRPRNEHGEEINPAVLNENQIGIGESIRRLFSIPTFVLLFMRSSFDGIPANANSLFILWYEYLGFTESEASFIVTVMYSSAAVSSLAGGIMADSLMKRSRVKLGEADRIVDQRRAALAEARRAHAASITNGANAEAESERVQDAQDDLYDAQADRTDAMNAMNNSRIIFAQVGALLALIFCIFHFKLGPKTKYMGGDTPLEDALWWFLPIGLLMNLVGNWDEQACDLPLMSYVVPPELRGTAFGTMTMTQTFWAFLATGMVGVVSEYGFHFNARVTHRPLETWSDEVRSENVRALGNGLLVVDVFALGCSVIVYGAVIFTYPHDREAVIKMLHRRQRDALKKRIAEGGETAGLLAAAAAEDPDIPLTPDEIAAAAAAAAAAEETKKDEPDATAGATTA